MSTNSLSELHKLFPYDFYASLQTYVNSLYNATLSEFAMPVSEQFQKSFPIWAKRLTQSVETRLLLFHQSRQNEEDVYTQEEFEKMQGEDGLWTLTYAVPNEELKKLNLADVNAMNNYDGPIIYIQVQLLDDDGKMLIAMDTSAPEPCWDVSDERLLLCFHKVENDEEGNGNTEDKLLDTKAAQKYIEMRQTS